LQLNIQKVTRRQRGWIQRLFTRFWSFRNCMLRL